LHCIRSAGENAGYESAESVEKPCTQQFECSTRAAARIHGGRATRVASLAYVRCDLLCIISKYIAGHAVISKAAPSNFENQFMHERKTNA
jgi:hypothetical protein